MRKPGRLCLGAMLVSLWAAGTAVAQGGASQAPQQLDRLLAYDTALPLDVKVVGVERKDGVAVEDVTFASVTGGKPTQAYVVRPDGGSGPFAGVLFVHWYAPRFPT